jgi:predicted hydrocarbon binding protein
MQTEIEDGKVVKAAYQGVDVTNAMRIVRPSLGDNAGVALYRLLRLVALEDIIGRGAAGTAYVAGKKLGVSLGLSKLDDLLELCASLKVGNIKVPIATATRVRVEVFECVTCAGLTPVGRTLCHFEGGLIAGSLQTIFKKQKVRAVESTCIGGLGDENCGFDLDLQ